MRRSSFLFLEPVTEILDVPVTVEQFDEYIYGLLHAFAVKPLQWSAFIEVFLAVNAEETADGFTEGKYCEIYMVLLLQPVAELICLSQAVPVRL